MAKKVTSDTSKNTYFSTFRNPLLIPLLLAVITIAYFVGKDGATIAPPQNSPIDNDVPTSHVAIPESIDEQGQAIPQGSTQAKVSITNAINDKVIYCDIDGAGAVRDINNQLASDKSRLDGVLVEQERCNNQCRDNIDEILKKCESSSDYEKCIHKCGGDCYETSQKQMDIVKGDLSLKIKSFNEIASKYCTQ